MKAIIFVINILFPLLIYAQISFKAYAPATAETGRTFKIRYVFKGDYSSQQNINFTPPSADGLKILGTSQSFSQSSSYTIINGKVKSEKTTSTIWILTCIANKEGDLQIPPATAVFQGKTYKSNSLVIAVGKNPDNNLPPPGNNQITNNYGTNIPKNKNFFLSINTNKNTAYVGEAIYFYATLYYANSVDLEDFKPGTFNNFWSESFKLPNNIIPDKKIINGKTYSVATLDKKLLFPQKPGELIITPYYAKLGIYQTDFFGFSMKTGEKEVYSNSKTITVKPLPQANKPDNFSGAVGNFDITINIEKDTFNLDEAFTITLTISGTGNFNLFDDPQINLPHTFEKLEPEITDNISLTPEGFNGEKIYKFSYIPRAPGKYVIQPISFSFFDPEKKAYVTQKTKEIEITITGKIDSNATTYTSSEQNSIEQLASDIQFIYTKKFKLKKLNNFLYEKTTFILSYFILAILFFIAIILYRQYQKNISNSAQWKFKKAEKLAKHNLKKAKIYLDKKETDKFYLEIERALNEYISNKLNIPKRQLNSEVIKEKLNEFKIDDNLKKEYGKIMNACLTARYAPEVANENASEIYSKTKNLILEIEKQLNKA